MPKQVFVILAVLIASIIAVGFWYFRTQPSNYSKSLLPLPEASPDMNQNKPEINSENRTAVITTTRGVITLELFSTIAPKTVANFVSLSRDGFYNGIKFHRVISEFMIQGGDPLSKTDDPRVGTGGPGYTFEDEINPKSLGLSDAEIASLQALGYQYNSSLQSLPVDVGVIVMANAGPNTNGSQFFIVTQSPQPHLNGRHTVFGKVTSGMDVVRAIRQGDVIQSIQIEG